MRSRTKGHLNCDHEYLKIKHSKKFLVRNVYVSFVSENARKYVMIEIDDNYSIVHRQPSDIA